MRHLTSYKIFEAKAFIDGKWVLEDHESLLLDIDDIFLELKDIGFHVEVFDECNASIPVVGVGGYENSIVIQIRKIIKKDNAYYKVKYNTNEIYPTVEWVVDYMKSKGFDKYFAWTKKYDYGDAYSRVPDVPAGIKVNFGGSSFTKSEISHKFKSIVSKIKGEKILPKNVIVEDEVKLLFAESKNKVTNW